MGDMIVVQYPNDVLSTDILSTVQDITAYLNPEWFVSHQETFDDMLRLMRKEGGVGLAANQVGLLEPFFVMDDGIRGPEVMICPAIMRPEGYYASVEGCLSCEKQAVITRPWRFQVAYIDRFGNPHRSKRSGLSACIIMHEIQHLQGLTIVDVVNQSQQNKETVGH